MRKNNYLAPEAKVSGSRLRVSILAGSDSDSVPGGNVTGKDFEFGARSRKSSSATMD